MSLKFLLKWHFFSVQTYEFATQDLSGGIDRKQGKIIIHENLRGNLQAYNTSMDQTRDDLGKVEAEITHRLFHNNSVLQLTTIHRILINKNNPRHPITDFSDNSSDDVRYFKVIGADREPVALRGRKTIFEVNLKEIFRGSI